MFAIGGIAFIGWALSVIVDNTLNRVVEEVGASDGDNQTTDPPGGGNSASLLGTEGCPPRGANCWTRLPRTTRTLILSIGVMVVLMAIGIGVFVAVEGMTFVNALYFVCISATTVGYGDEEPMSPGGKVFSMFWLAVSCTWLGNVIQGVLSYGITRNLEERRKQLLGRDLVFGGRFFRALDENQDGHVTKYVLGNASIHWYIIYIYIYMRGCMRVIYMYTTRHLRAYCCSFLSLRYDFLKYHLVEGKYPVNKEDIGTMGARERGVLLNIYLHLDVDGRGHSSRYTLSHASYGSLTW